MSLFCHIMNPFSDIDIVNMNKEIIEIKENDAITRTWLLLCSLGLKGRNKIKGLTSDDLGEVTRSIWKKLKYI